MPAILIYMLKVVAASAMLMVYYYVALRNKTFHEWNRFYLLVVPVISLVIPLFTIPVYVKHEQILNLTGFAGQVQHIALPATQNNSLNWQEIVFITAIIIYCTVCVIKLARMLLDYNKISLLKSSGNKNLVKDNIFLYYTDSPQAPFSFFNTIFWNDNISLCSPEGQQILKHEMVHVKEKHSLDKIFIHIIVCFVWFNPFYWLLRKELEVVHEFIADKKSASSTNVETMALAVLKTVYPSSAYCFANNFFHSSIKRRLIMLTQKNKSRYSFLLKTLSLPVLIIAFFTTVGYTQKTDTTTTKSKSPVVSVSGFKATGKVIYYLDGKEVTKAEIDKLNPNDVERTEMRASKITVDSNKKITTLEGSNSDDIQGVIFVTTKKGSKNAPPPPPPPAPPVSPVKYDTLRLINKINTEQEQTLEGYSFPSNVLFIINDKESTKAEFKNISVKDIHMVDVLKDKAAVEKYGEKAEVGVIVVYTKDWIKAHPEKSEIEQK